MERSINAGESVSLSVDPEAVVRSNLLNIQSSVSTFWETFYTSEADKEEQSNVELCAD